MGNYCEQIEINDKDFASVSIENRQQPFLVNKFDTKSFNLNSSDLR